MTIEKLFALHADAKTKFILWIYYMVEKIYNVDINMIQNLIPKLSFLKIQILIGKEYTCFHT